MGLHELERSQAALDRRQYRGQHRLDEVGSLRWSDEGCLIAYRMHDIIEKKVQAQKCQSV
jgi:hypothetical protein